jgi:hypothetical protein
VNQLKRIGEYERALQVALAEVELEEKGGRITGEHATVPGTTGRQLRSIGGSSDTMKRSP